MLLATTTPRPGLPGRGHRFPAGTRRQQAVTALLRSIAGRDGQTARHCHLVCLLATRLAQAMGLPAGQVDLVRTAALLHDLGKLAVPDRILRKPASLTANERRIENELLAKRFCRERARKLKLEMKISRVDFALNARHATFYFTANGRVDFRQLVRELSQRFSTRVRMVQVGARDEAALLGGVGICGRTLCCSTWLKDFKPISIQMAKRQNLSLNPSKISGQCGRLLCCLAYEDDQYQKKPAKRRKSPAPASG